MIEIQLKSYDWSEDGEDTNEEQPKTILFADTPLELLEQLVVAINEDAIDIENNKLIINQM